MKKYSYLPLVLLVVVSIAAVKSAAAQDADVCLPPPDGLSGWWPGDGSTEDIVGGRDAVLHDDATIESGLVGQAFVLDGDGDFVDVPHDPALNLGTDDFTVDLWVLFDDTAGEQVLVEKWIQRGSDDSEGWTLTSSRVMSCGWQSRLATIQIRTRTWIRLP